MRYYLLLLLGLLASQFARAQDDRAGARPYQADTVGLPASAALPDTAAALHRLFAAKRGLRATIGLGTLAGGGVALAVDGLAASDLRNGWVSLATQSQLVLVTSLALLVELRAENQYSRQPERLAVGGWRRHRLAPDLRRLTPHYFAPNDPPRPQAPAAPLSDLFTS